MTRKYFRSSIQELEALYKSQKDDLELLYSLQDELTHRKKPRAIKLRNLIAERLTALKTDTLSQDPSTHHESSHHAQSASRSPEEPPSHYLKPAPAKLLTKVELPKSKAGPVPPSPLPPITNRPDEILSAWTALEVLSPSNFVRPEELASGDRSRVAELNESSLPWERGERSRPKQRLYYQVVLGSIKMQPAVEQLIERYGDTRPEKPRVRGKAALAIVVVNHQGQLVESSAVGISSFGWGAISALNGELADLGRWPEIEPQLTERIETLLLGNTVGNKDGEEARKHPLTREGLFVAYETLLR